MEKRGIIFKHEISILILLFLIGQSVIAQETAIQIVTENTNAAVYSENGFLGSTKFKEIVDFKRLRKLYVAGENELFEIVLEDDFDINRSLTINLFSIDSLVGQHGSINLESIQILTEKLEPSAPNAYFHNAIYDEDHLNTDVKEFIAEHAIFNSSNEAVYTLSGVVEKDIVFWDGLNPNKHKCLFVDVNWTLKNQETSSIVLESIVKGGHYFGTKFKPKNQADLVESTAYAYRKAVISSFLQFLRSEQMATKEYLNESLVAKDAKETLRISTGTNFCTEISECAQASVTIQTQKSTGSGFFISNNGYILTNHHVIKNQENPTIILQNGISIPVSVIRSDEKNDVALLKASINSVTSIKISKDTIVNIGEDVFAIGSPKGAVLSQTTSRGIVSAYRTGEKAMIQTDVSVNSGNSGGPLLNVNNKVIGIVTSKLIGDGVEGIAFAIPINDALTALNIKLE